MSQGSSDEPRGVSSPLPVCQSWLKTDMSPEEYPAPSVCQSWLVTVTPSSSSPQLSLYLVFQLVSWLRWAGGPLGSPSCSSLCAKETQECCHKGLVTPLPKVSQGVQTVTTQRAPLVPLSCGRCTGIPHCSPLLPTLPRPGSGKYPLGGH